MVSENFTYKPWTPTRLNSSPTILQSPITIMSSSLLKSVRTKLFFSSSTSSAPLYRTFSSYLHRSLHSTSSSPPHIGGLTSLFHRNSTTLSLGSDNLSKGNLTGLPEPNDSVFGNLNGLRPLNVPINKLGSDSIKFSLPSYNALGLDTVALARAGNGLGSSRVWAAKGHTLLGVRGAYADTLGLTSHNRIMSTAATASATNETKSYSLRPLSPHLPVYQPQLSSTLSIFNRISGAILAAVILLFYMIYVKMGSVSLTHDSFYQFLFYSSKLNLLIVEISGLALTYHLYMGIRHLLHLI